MLWRKVAALLVETSQANFREERPSWRPVNHSKETLKGSNWADEGHFQSSKWCQSPTGIFWVKITKITKPIMVITVHWPSIHRFK
jgi:hypothetical protein